MKYGKHTCKILKEIRKQIAAANDIELVTEECRYKGDCLGTCPRCEAEVSYLEQQLSRRQAAGKAVSLVGLSLSVVAMSTQLIGCGTSTPANSVKNEDTTAAEKCRQDTSADAQYNISKDTIPANPKKHKKEDQGTVSLVDLPPLQGDIVAVSDNYAFYQKFNRLLLTQLFKDYFVMPAEVDTTNEFKVDIRFTVNRDESLTNISVVPSYGEAFENEVVRVLRLISRVDTSATDSVGLHHNLPIVFTPNAQSIDTTKI